MRAKFRFLGNDHRIDVRNAKMAFNEQLAHALQKSQACGILPLRVGVWKMRANVAQPRGTQERIANGMRQCIAVGMPYWALVEWELDSAEDEFAAFSEAMQVVSDSRAGH